MTTTDPTSTVVMVEQEWGAEPGAALIAAQEYDPEEDGS